MTFDGHVPPLPICGDTNTNTEQILALQRQLEVAEAEMFELREHGKELAKDLAVCTRQRRDEVTKLRDQLSQLAPTRDQFLNAYVIQTSQNVRRNCAA